MVKRRFINGCSKSVSLVREFEAMGWDAWTCDLLPSEGWHKHIQDDVLKHLADGWDFGIFHPDCTYLANSGVRWLHENCSRTGQLYKERWEEMIKATQFFNAVDAAPFPHVLENPIQHRYARRYIRVYDQIIQPYNFGVLESKAICLWLVGVPKLILPITEKPDGVKQSVWRESPSVDRKANRARNFPGISKAMASQWSAYYFKL